MFARPKTLINSLSKLLIKLNYHSLADEVAEPRPAMHIKVAAFTVSEKSINTCDYLLKSNTQRYVLTHLHCK